jgi:hypothetical protein
MKNRIYYLGMLTTLIIVTGCLFKIMHLAGANILLTTGLGSFALIFLPLAVVSLYRSEENRRQRIFYILTGIVLAADAIGVLFKVMHWPGAGPLLLITLPLPFLVLLPYFLLMHPDEKRVNYKNFVAILFFFAYDATVAALLSTSVSKNITDGYLQNAAAFQERAEMLHEKAARLNTEEVGIKADQLCHEIGSIRNELIESYSGNSDKVIKDGTTIDFLAIKRKDSRVYVDTVRVRGIMEELGKLRSLTRKPSATDDTLPEIGMPDGNILAAALERLNLLEYEVRLAEYEAFFTL